jgi:cell division protease FtsH
MFLPEEDRYLMTKAELLDQIGTALGGRAAEELIFDQISSGARDDLRRASEIARMMVKEYGMSEKLGLVTFESTYSSAFMSGQGPSESFYSDKTAYQIDVEVKTIIDETYLRVQKILDEHNELLKTLAQVLLEKEVIEHDEFTVILGKEGAEDLVQDDVVSFELPSSEKDVEENDFAVDAESSKIVLQAKK